MSRNTPLASWCALLRRRTQACKWSGTLCRVAAAIEGAIDAHSL